MLIDSAAHIWQRLEQHARIEARPVRSGLETWIAKGATHLADAEALQVRRDYRRLCSLLDQLETLLHDEPRALAIVRDRATASPFP